MGARKKNYYLGHIDVLRVVELLVLAVHDGIDHPRLEVQED